MSAAPIRIGTSGWSYGHWRGVFYPPGLPASCWLAWYARRLDTVEINASFYRLPTVDAVAAWRDAVPADFVFSAKASRYITHMKRLKAPEASLPPFLERMAGLGKALGPVLFQLPPRWEPDPARLAAFLAALPAGRAATFEFRDPAWWREDVYALLARHGVAFCIHDLGGKQSPLVATARLVYVRLHGPGGPYRGCYDDRALAAWADRCRSWAADGREVFCYFDNDQAGFAAANALRLRQMLGDR